MDPFLFLINTGGNIMQRYVKNITLALSLTLAFAGPSLGFELNLKGSLADNGHKRYVPPLAIPYFNETPYITTEARPVFIHHDIPTSFVTGGGTIDLYALEIRVALTERLGFIATKDGYADVNFDSVLPDTDGFMNISLGFKYAIISNPKENTIVTLGVEYEAPTGSLSTASIDMQGGGDGLVDIFVTGAKAFDKLGLQGSTGFNIAIDGDHNSSLWHWSAHADYELVENFFPLLELNGISTIDDGNRTGIAPFEGNDIVNFGSTASGSVVTLGLGARYKFNNHVQVGAGYEFPITDREDLFNWRTNFDLVITF